MRENRIKFNQSMMFKPDEIVRFFNHLVHRMGEADEIASKFKLKNRKYEVVSRQGTVYELRELESSATRQHGNTEGTRESDGAHASNARCHGSWLEGNAHANRGSPDGG